MKYLFDVSIIVATLVVMLIAYNSNYFTYKNCMSQTKYDTITQKGAEHIAAQCKAFVLDKIMVK